MLDLVELGGQIRSLREALKKSREDLAKDCEVHRNTIAALETGTAAGIQVNLLLRIMNAVGLDLRVTTLNGGRPTLEDVARENVEEDGIDAPRLGR